MLIVQPYQIAAQATIPPIGRTSCHRDRTPENPAGGRRNPRRSQEPAAADPSEPRNPIAPVRRVPSRTARAVPRPGAHVPCTRPGAETLKGYRRIKPGAPDRAALHPVARPPVPARGKVVIRPQVPRPEPDDKASQTERAMASTVSARTDGPGVVGPAHGRSSAMSSDSSQAFAITGAAGRVDTMTPIPAKHAADHEP